MLKVFRRFLKAYSIYQIYQLVYPSPPSSWHNRILEYQYQWESTSKNHNQRLPGSNAMGDLGQPPRAYRVVNVYGQKSDKRHSHGVAKLMLGSVANKLRVLVYPFQ